MPHIVAFRSKGQSTPDGISVVLTQDAVITGPDGDPWCGVTMDAEQARCLARRLHSIATEIENDEEYGYRTSPLLLEHASTVVVLHDGSLQSHRACQAAMQYAHRSLGNLDLIGIFGIDARDGDIKVVTDDSDWQKGWLSRLAGAYLQQAEASGVTFTSQFLPAHDPCVVLDLLYRMTFDLLVIPKRLSQFGIHGERLMPSIINRKNVNVLVCP
jgi:hypothetical protein